MTLKAVTGVARPNKKVMTKPQPFLLKQKWVNIGNLILSLSEDYTHKKVKMSGKKIHN